MVVSKTIYVNTALFHLFFFHSFKLQKYNLYREESEGFAILFDLLDYATPQNVSVMIDKITELAGEALFLICIVCKN